MDLCIHDMIIASCATCTPPSDPEFAAEFEQEPGGWFAMSREVPEFGFRGPLAKGWTTATLGI